MLSDSNPNKSKGGRTLAQYVDRRFHERKKKRIFKILCDEINSTVLRQETAEAIALGYINERVKRVGEYAAYISENVINYLVEEDRIPKKKKLKL